MSEKSSTPFKTSNEPAAKGPKREAQLPVKLGLASTILRLQRTTGNQGMGRLLGGVILQPKLRIGPAGGAHEREADRVADAVLGNGPTIPISEADGSVQRMCPECEEELVQRMCAECKEEQEEEELLQPKSDGAPPATASPAFETRLGSLRGSGRPLPADLRSFFEPRFSHDFGAVRVHTGSAAGETAQAVRARAFTVGNDVVFGAGEWSPGTTSGKRLLAHELTHVVQQTPQEARRKPLLQRAAQEETAPGPESPEPSPETSTPESSPATAIVVEDSTEEVGEGQMKKSDFLARLRTEVCAATETGLAGTAYSAQGCPLIEFWFGYYEGISVERINRDLPRFVEAEPRPATAADYITVITERVRRSVSIWASTGEITGVPRDLPLPGMNLPGVGASAPQVSETAPSGVSFKALPGGPRDPGNPQALRARLGAGRPLDGGIRSRMESAFGRSFGHVRVHTEGQSSGLAQRLNARAFTVGSHVAFGAGEYRPGTLVGDALIAHELAHVAQQGGAAAVVQPMGSANASYGALERDADLAAVGAVASLWGLRLPGLRNLLSAAPRRRSGLRLQRCENCDGPDAALDAAPTTTPDTDQAPTPQAPKPAPPPKPLFEQFQTGPDRQKAIDNVIGEMGGKIDASLLENGKMHYNGAIPTGEGMTFPPNDESLKARRKGAANKKPYVEIYGGAFADGWPLLRTTVWHEYQHVLQMAPKSSMLVPGVNAAGNAQETEAYSKEIIAAEEEKLHLEAKVVTQPKSGGVQELTGKEYIEKVLWRRLTTHWGKVQDKGMRKKLQPLVAKAKAAAERMVGHPL